MDDLPQEVITTILQYVSFQDRQNARLINSKWLHASLDPVIISNDVFVIKGEKVDGPKDLIGSMEIIRQILKESKRHIFNFKFCDFDENFPKYESILDGISEKVSELYFENIDMMTDTFGQIVIKCCNLKKLELKNIIQWSMTVPEFKPISSLTTQIFTLKFFPSEIFRFLTSLAPNMDTVDLNFNIPNLDIMTNPYVKEKDIRQFLKTVKRIKNLDLNENCHVFKKLPDDIQLKTLRIQYRPLHRELYQFDNLIGKHIFLKKLEIICLPCCSLISITKLCQLEELNLTFFIQHSCELCTVKQCLQSFCNSMKLLKNLKRLSFLPDERTDSSEDLPSIPDYTLQSLEILDYFINQDKNILLAGKDIVKLRIRNGNILEASDYKILFKNHTNLKELCIENCSKLNDAVLLDSEISNIKGLQHLRLYGGQLTNSCLDRITFLNLQSVSFISEDEVIYYDD